MVRTIALFGHILLLAPCFLLGCSVNKPDDVDQHPVRTCYVAEDAFAAADEVEQILIKHPTSASFEYKAKCGTSQDSLKLKHIGIGRSLTLSRALTELFADEPRIRSSKDRDGILRIRDTELSPNNLLQVRISRISFEHRKDGEDFIDIILNTRAVKAFIAEHKLKHISILTSLIQGPWKTLRSDKYWTDCWNSHPQTFGFMSSARQIQ
jgi:hypothetical protein